MALISLNSSSYTSFRPTQYAAYGADAVLGQTPLPNGAGDDYS